jgi:excisionase family DNA binding protein
MSSRKFAATAKKRLRQRRARRVLALQCQGMAAADIAVRLQLSLSLVRSIIAGKKTGARRNRRVDRERIRHLAASGLSQIAIARRLQTTRQTVGAILAAAPIEHVADPARERASEILKLIDGGASFQAVRQQIRCGTDSIYKLLRMRAAGEVPRLGKHRFADGEIGRQRRKLVLAAAARGKTQAELARRFGVSRATVYRDLRDAAQLSAHPALRQVLQDRGAAWLKTRAEIRRLARRGLNGRTIARRLKVSIPLAYNVSAGIAYRFAAAPPPTAARVKALYQLQGISKEQIARYLKISKTTVEKALASDVAPRAHEPLHPHRARALRVIALRRDGASFLKIRRLDGADHSTVLRAIAIEASGRPATIVRSGVAADPAVTRRLRRQGLTMTAIAGRLDVSPATIERHLRRQHSGAAATAAAANAARGAPRIAGRGRARPKTLAEAARALGVETADIAEAIATGELAAIRVGRKLLLPYAVVEELRFALRGDRQSGS